MKINHLLLNICLVYETVQTRSILNPLNDTTMFTETQHRALIDECKEWYNVLAAYRQKLNKLQEELYFFAPGKTEIDVKAGIEHFHNQFHIQLINIHDVKHEIRHHIQEAERHPTFGHRIPHHQIKDNLDRLIHDLDELENDFHQFIKR